MGRQRRPYLPGAVFHLAARTIRGEHWLMPPQRSAALRFIADATARSRSRVLAVAIMSNHLHVVAQQGVEPLDRLMQPVLRRLALRVQKAHDLEGPIFWRPYASWPCLHPRHARNSVAYVHLNPVRAGLCDDPAEYPWTTHPLYSDASADAGPPLDAVAKVVDPTLALPLFASTPDRSIEELRADYRAFLEWRLAQDDWQGSTAPGEDGGAPPSRPAIHWRTPKLDEPLSPLYHAPATGAPGRQRTPDGGHRPDMKTIAEAVLALEAPSARLEAIRGPLGGRRASRLRHAIIRRLHQTGYRNVQIARFLGLSESAVSYVVCKGWQ